MFVVLPIRTSLIVDNFFPFPTSCKQLLSQESKLFDLIHLVSIDFPPDQHQDDYFHLQAQCNEQCGVQALCHGPSLPHHAPGSDQSGLQARKQALPRPPEVGHPKAHSPGRQLLLGCPEEELIYDEIILIYCTLMMPIIFIFNPSLSSIQ